MRIVNETLDQGFSKLEGGLNQVGYIPVASTISGAARICYGKYMLVAAVAVSFFIALSAVAAQDKSRRLGQAVDFAFEYGVHGVGNIIRGSVEFIPLVNLTCLIYDKVVGIRMNYRYETVPLHTRAIFQY
jgi:hypothetical protein